TRPSTSSASYTVTTLGCASLASARASPRTRTASSDVRSTLTATLRSSRGSYAANTVPIAPAPMTSTSTSRPSFGEGSPPNGFAFSLACRSSSTRSRNAAQWYTNRVRSDVDLLAAWRAGDRAAGEELVERHWTSVSRFVRSKIGDDGADLISQV